MGQRTGTVQVEKLARWGQMFPLGLMNCCFRFQFLNSSQQIPPGREIRRVFLEKNINSLSHTFYI